jgi:hypothetical protein
MDRKKSLFKFLAAGVLGVLMLIGLLLRSQTIALANTPLPTHVATGSITLVPSAATINAGDSFDLAVQITINSPTCDAQAGLSFDPKLVEVTGVTEGDFYKNYATAQNITTFMMPQNPQADNSAGNLPFTGVALIGGKCGPTGTGNLYVVHLKAKANGAALFSLTKIRVDDDGSLSSGSTKFTVPYEGITTSDLMINIGGTGTAQVMPTKEVVVYTPIAAIPTQEATAVLLPTQASTDVSGSGGSSFPWLIVVPVVGVVVIAGVVVLTSRKKK